MRRPHLLPLALFGLLGCSRAASPPPATESAREAPAPPQPQPVRPAPPPETRRLPTLEDVTADRRRELIHTLGLSEAQAASFNPPPFQLRGGPVWGNQRPLERRIEP